MEGGRRRAVPRDSAAERGAKAGTDPDNLEKKSCSGHSETGPERCTVLACARLPQRARLGDRTSGKEGVMRVLRILIGGIIATTSVVAATVGARPQTAQIAEGKQKSAFYCASCHGAEGKGDGTLSKSLRKRPANLTQLAKKTRASSRPKRSPNSSTGGAATRRISRRTCRSGAMCSRNRRPTQAPRM